MDVTVNVKLRFKPADWTKTFGEEAEADIRQAVKQYVGGLVAEHGVFGNGEVPVEVNWK